MRSYPRLLELLIVTVDFKRLPALFCFSLGALCALLTTTLVLEHRLVKVAQQQSQNYGAALARMGAQQSVDAALNHDLVSLQVVLQDIASNPGVLLATMHDVENHLLVQAGQIPYSRKQGTELNAHTAPVTLHDSVAGYVTVTLTPPQTGSVNILFATLALALLLAVVGGLSLYEHRHSVISYRRPTRDEQRESDNEREALAEGVAAKGEELNYEEMESDELTDDDLFHAYALLCINTQDLRQQLTPDLFQAAMDGLDSLLDDVLALYNGRAIDRTSREGLYLLQFDSTESDAEAVFRTTCSLYLTLHLAAHLQPIPLSPGAVISLDNGELLEAEPPVRAGQVLLESASLDDGVLPQRLITTTFASHEGYLLLQDFQPPFADLLERQYQQLRKFIS